MKGRLLLFCLFLLMGATIFAQDTNEGNLSVYQDVKVDSLISKYVQINDIYPIIEGFRIEIFFEAGNYSKNQALEAKSKFVQQFPEVPSYLIFQQPYYKVRVGDFRSKMEAQKFLHHIEYDYPQAFVVKDEINFPKLD